MILPIYNLTISAMARETTQRGTKQAKPLRNRLYIHRVFRVFLSGEKLNFSPPPAPKPWPLLPGLTEGPPYRIHGIFNASLTISPILSRGSWVGPFLSSSPSLKLSPMLNPRPLPFLSLHPRIHRKASSQSTNEKIGFLSYTRRRLHPSMDQVISSPAMFQDWI